MNTHRNPGLRGRLSFALVGVALVSVVLLSVVNYVFARLLIDDSVRAQLENVRDTRVEALENGFDQVVSAASTLAANPTVIAALEELATEYGQLDEDITPEQRAGLGTIYDDEFLPRFVEAGVGISADQLLPETAAGRYLQQHYIAENPNGFDERGLLDDAGDGSGYSAAHARYHPVLRELMRSIRASDLLLVDADTAQVVYSVQKRIDLGTDGLNWPRLGDENQNVRGVERALEQLSGVAVGDATVSDVTFYVPTRGEPVLFVAAAVRSGSNVLGAIIAELPDAAISSVITAQQDWRLLGLGDTGEAYVVGPDGTLRTESRPWTEDRADYLRRFVKTTDDQARADLIEAVGSPVLLQQVDNASVSAALNGGEFTGTVTNYLGTEVLSVSAPVNVRGLDWAVIVEQHTSESNSALDSLVRAMLVVLAVLLPLIAVIGWLLARTLTHPAQRLVDVAARIADGNLETEVEDLGSNELGDLGRQLEGVAHQLEAQGQAIVDEEQRIVDMLGAALPARLVGRVRRGEAAIGDIFDTATAIAVTIDGIPEAAGSDQDLALEITDRLTEGVDALLERYGVERVQRSSGSQLYLAGLDQSDARIADATAFVFAAIEMLAEVSAEFGLALTARVGMSVGDVATGVLGSHQISFGVWGDPPALAVTLASLAQPGQVLADDSVVEQLGPDWDVGPLAELSGLADDIGAHVINGAIGAAPAPR